MLNGAEQAEWGFLKFRYACHDDQIFPIFICPAVTEDFVYCVPCKVQSFFSQLQTQLEKQF